MNDFIFGTLATDELRRARVQGVRASVTHGARRNPRDPEPNQTVSLVLSSGPAHPGERAWVYWTVDGSDPVGASGVPSNGFSALLMPVSSEWDTELWGYIRHFSGQIPGQPAGTVVRYRLSLEEFGKGEVFADQGTTQAFFVDNDPPPAWAQDAIIYQVFVDRFFPGEGRSWLTPRYPSGFYGGRISGLTQKLDYLSLLGVNTLWLSPIFPSPSHHGYDVTDLFEIEPRLGTKDDLRILLDAAHRRGIRILLDFVPNHISDEHPIFQDAVRNPTSPYRTWFNFTHWPDEYETFFGVKSLPQLNLRDPGARQHVLDAARYWLEFGVDGYRLDYAIGPAVDFWADFRRVTRQVKPDCWTFGEIVDPPDVQLTFSGLLDGALDFMLLEALRKACAFGNWGTGQLAGFLTRHEAAFPPTFSRPSFLDNHDMNRFLWAAGGDINRLKLAALLQFCLSGQPIIYYGTEVGLSQLRDVRQGTHGLPEESRLPMLWGGDQNSDLWAFYHNLIEIRNHSKALKAGDFQILEADTELLVFDRNLGDEKIRFIANLSSQVQAYHFHAEKMKVLLHSQPVDSGNVAKDYWIDLPGSAGVVIKIEE